MEQEKTYPRYISHALITVAAVKYGYDSPYYSIALETLETKRAPEIVYAGSISHDAYLANEYMKKKQLIDEGNKYIIEELIPSYGL